MIDMLIGEDASNTTMPEEGGPRPCTNGLETDAEYAAKVILIKDACEPLFPHAIHGASHKLADELFVLFSRFVLPNGNIMPTNRY